MNEIHKTVDRAVETVITCDSCRRSYVTAGCIGITDLKRLLKTNGWSVGKYIKCPECRPKRRS